MRLSLRQKVSLGISTLVVGTTILVGTIANVAITRAIESKTRRDLLTGRQVFEEFQRLRFRELLTNARMVAEVPHLKAVVTTPDIDHATVLDSARAVQRIVNSDLFMMCDREGKLLASVTEPARHADDMTASPVFAGALAGGTFQGIWSTDGGIYQVVTVPFLFDREVVGALMTGFSIDREWIEALEKVTNTSVALVSPQRVVTASSAGGLFDFLAHGFPQATESSAQHLTRVFNGERYSMLVVPLQDYQAAYVLARSLDQELLFYRALQRHLFGVVIGVLFIALILGMSFSRRVTQPIQALVKGTQRIASGDLAAKVSVSATDELGALAAAFNAMAENLQHTTVSRDVLLKEIAARRQAEEQLSEYAQRLERSNQELDDFTYIVSHDLKEPLRSIEAFSRFLEEDARGALTEESRGYVERIRANAARMKALIEDLLALSRLAQRPNQVQRVAVATVLESVKGRFDYLVQERHVQLMVQEGLPVIACDPVRLGEVFANLISNAIKHNDKPVPRIEIGGRATEGYHEFFVKDNGPGIEPQYFQKIFEIFQRLDKKQEQEGTGVGLAIVKKIVELHHGRMWVESAMGQGTTFYFTVIQDEQVLLGKKKLDQNAQRQG